MTRKVNKKRIIVLPETPTLPAPARVELPFPNSLGTSPAEIECKPSLRVLAGIRSIFHQQFALKIAIANMLMFCTMWMLDLEPFLAVSYDPSRYTLGRLLYPLSILIFFANLLLIGDGRRWRRGVLLAPAANVAIACALTAINCGGLWVRYVFWIVAYTFVAVLAAAIHSTRVENRAIQAPLSAQIEWIKQTADFWRTLAISGAIAYFAALMPWMQYMLALSSKTYSDPASQRKLQDAFTVQMVACTAFVLVGPLYELIRKSAKARNLLINVRVQSEPLSTSR